MTRLSHNIIALSAVQVGNFLVPFLALPYMARVLGAEAYGHVVWVQTIMLFGVIWVDFGFGWSATQEVSIHRDNVARLSHLFANTWTVQWLLALLFAFFVVIFVSVLGNDEIHTSLYLAGLGIVFGQILLPLWLFQGMEALRELAAIQLLGKLLTLPFVFFWVNSPDDAFAALLFFSSSALMPGVMAIAWIHYRHLVNWVLPDFNGIRLALTSGALLFSSRALISLYTTIVPLAVGYLAGPVQLAYFNLADKLKMAVQILLTPVSQALFPRMSWLYAYQKSNATALLCKFAFGLTLVSIFAGLALWSGAEQLMVLLGGSDFSQGADILRWLAFVPVMVSLSNLMGVQMMLPQGMHKPFAVILSFAALGSLVGLYPMIANWGAVGAAQLVLIIEVFVTVQMAFYLWRR